MNSVAMYPSVVGSRAPLCPKHQLSMEPLREAFVPAGRSVILFQCEKCETQSEVPIPTCVRCTRKLILQGGPRGINSYKWHCNSDNLFARFELCECDGVGWLHFDNRNGTDEEIIGTPFGKHIEQCAICAVPRFSDNILAHHAHRVECGCGHGDPDPQKPTTWVDYGGPNGEVVEELKSSGFALKDLGAGEYETLILPGRGAAFMSALNRVYTRLLTREVQNDFRQAAKTPSFIGYNRLLETGRTSSTEKIISNPPRPGTLEKEVVLLRQMVASQKEIIRLGEERREAVKKGAYNLLSQLNSMNFQDHPIEEQRRLELARRGMIEVASRGRPCVLNDNASLRNEGNDQLFLVGGYRIESLERSEDASVLVGTCCLGGLNHHVTLIEVTSADGEQRPVNDPHEWYYDFIGKFNNEAMVTVKVPGFPGDYVLCIYPRSV